MSSFDDRLKESATLLGHAIIAAQMFEQGLVIVLVLTENLSEGPLPDDLMDSLHSKTARKTLGGLLNSLRSKFDFSDDHEEILGDALESRNFLAHRIWTEHGNDLLTAEGQANWKNVVRQKVIAIKRADDVIQTIIDPLFQFHGVDQEEILDRVKKLMN